MNENDFILVINGEDYCLKDSHDDDMSFKYNLGLAFPKKNFKNFAKKSFNLYQSLLKIDVVAQAAQVKELNIEQIFETLISTQNQQIVFEYLNFLTKIGLENGVKIFRSNDRKTFLDQYENTSEELRDLIYSNNIVNIYRDTSRYLSDLADEDLAANLILCDEKLKTFAEKEFDGAAQAEYFNAKEFPLTHFANSINALNNIAVTAANLKLYDPNGFNDFYKQFLETWNNYTFNLFYDKYKNVRATALQISKVIMELKEESNKPHKLNVDDDNDDK